MGGWGSGRQGGRPTADSALFVEIGWMLRTGRAEEGRCLSGRLSWTCRGEPSGTINYTCDMRDLHDAHLELRFTVTTRSTGDKRDYVQRVPLSYTVPHYGGRRWWMHCPVNGSRVGKLYVPAGGDIFASRTAWRLGYHSQRSTHRDRPFEALFRLQKKLGGKEGWEAGLYRPKGMWRLTYERHWQRYLELDAICAAEMMGVMSRLRDRVWK